MRTHHGLYDSVFEKDEEKDHDGHLDLAKDKLTLSECVFALVLALTCVSMHAVFLGMYPLCAQFDGQRCVILWLHSRLATPIWCRKPCLFTLVFTVSQGLPTQNLSSLLAPAH